MSTFEIRDNFYLDGEPVRIISGAVHYFRIVPQYWRDRLEKLKSMGCNTVETYIPWNMHEQEKGQFRFQGMLDIEGFIRLARELGLYVIVRPSPYICAEWEFGGLPAWLLREDGMRLRVSYGPFLRHVEEYYKVLLPKLTPWQCTKGGPVILMQVENEYGYYANDRGYLEEIRKLMRRGGVEVPLVTSDGPFPESLNGGKLPGALPTGNFGSRTEERFGMLRQYTEGGPLMCTEFWVGWFDHWGNGGHMRGNLEESVKDLDKMLELGHVNIYMFEGGTNFGFMNGSNYYDELTPDVTSYDYDAVLTEDGQITEKYRRYREVIGKYAVLPEMEFSTEIRRKSYGTLEACEKVSLVSTLDSISKGTESVWPQSMERLGQNYGYILYRTTLHTEENLEKIRLWGANDRADILLDDKLVATLYDRELLKERELNLPARRDARLDILMENMGRVNFGPYMERQRKGIDQCVQINGHMHNHWVQYPLPLDNVDKVDFDREYLPGTPAFYRFVFNVEEIGDTFLDFEGWGKGCAFVNGFNIGRFWEIGPQKRLYIPGPLLREGENEIILFETEGKAPGTIALQGEPDIG
nr:beta-galactosidase family protein [uncultured Acetatifactor sp.]